MAKTNSHSTFKARIEKYIQDWEERCYPDGIPDTADPRLEQLNKVPSYRKLCHAILKNDFTLSSLGMTKPKPPIYHHLKRAELATRHGKKENTLF